MKFYPKSIAFFQALGLALYVGLFAFLAIHIVPWFENNPATHPALGIILFLLAFVISAVISGSIILGYPIFLFFEGKRKDALKIVLWSVVWLLLLLGIFVVMALLSLPAKS
ncbi:MAG: hypothetical protein RBG1_1C00001G0731 [candidate division Zixibacteria bacterium RBG-1]|nr:MAG: hypothetical protein RBG1_1C00001G0731 [candidate division Zixibacteria bacterium RBG-1]OGC86365.1 MAG: hypothetical protein A2V73_02590 [candidate division Zixibacteria bacterium RBG_19FT_COMBO_42_43]